MYKVLYIGFLTFQLISVFCNLKSLKKRHIGSIIIAGNLIL